MEKEIRPYVDITENDVKKVTLRFLKHYYRFRPRSVDAIISADMRGMGGIVADGYLAFPQDDGQLFMATFEATSADTRDEVQFSLRWESLRWDAWTLAILGAANLRLAAHISGWFMLNQWGPWLWWASLVAVAFVLAYFYQLTFRSLRRYRYIHAVEQFKQYHADDQWIAIGDNVFPSTEHVYFKELRRQCIQYGFGLIIIDRHLHPQLYITPAREDQFRKRRSTVEFVRQSDWMQQIQDSRYAAVLRRRIPWLFKSEGRRDKASRRRFRRPHYNHLVVILFSLLGIGGIYFREWERRPVDYQEQTEYVMARLRDMQDNSLEPTIYVMDSTQIWPFRKDMRPYMGNLWENETDQPAKKEKTEDEADVIVNIGNNEFVLYDCTRFFNLESKKYLIQEGRYPDLELASRRMYQLSAEGVPAHTIWAGCFNSDQEGYIVYLDELHNSLQEASARADAIQDTLAKDQIAIRLEIKVVSPPEELR